MEAGNRFLNQIWQMQFDDDNLDEEIGKHLIRLQYLSVM